MTDLTLEQRARFETWLSTQPGATPVITVLQAGGAKEDTRYMSPSTSLAWSAWQAALQQAQQPGAQAVAWICRKARPVLIAYTFAAAQPCTGTSPRISPATGVHRDSGRNHRRATHDRD